jgi:hypothetical protein
MDLTGDVTSTRHTGFFLFDGLDFRSVGYAPSMGTYWHIKGICGIWQ